MYLPRVLGVASAEDLDPSRPLKLGSFELGTEATAEAVRILEGGNFPRQVSWQARDFTRPMYWSIAHRAKGDAEVFGFPMGVTRGLPTAVEIALVRAVAAASPENHGLLLEGGAEIALGPPNACCDFRRVIAVISRPLAGKSLLFEDATQAIVDDDIGARLDGVALSCLANSFRASPLKFRFLELYRMMEARFLADIKTKLLAGFNSEPRAALGDAVEALKSEMKQIIGLAETQKDAFEACWTALDQLKSSNRFAAALFRRVGQKGATAGGKWKTGAALVYQIRCAVVHAGEKDIILENFLDGEDAIETVLPHVERAALLLVGIELI